ncbi:sulfatase/phosphatase domain-containing protein [Paenibacillus phytorum]|uniref:sulfatase/phosphatase domain-containing protein n=1 Tax=Paenibacillus phytorum TaxID=2654977 RepID=UPI00248442D9|nr:sulfatase/phosphatase domain-containing protein [Paenibacillus phytorum]
MPGSSFDELLRGEAGAGREDIVIYDEYGPVRMIRTRDWKYVHRYPYGPHELYDLQNDPNEDANRIDDAECQEVLEALRYRLGEWFGKYVIPEKDGRTAPVTGFGQLSTIAPGVTEGGAFKPFAK